MGSYVRTLKANYGYDLPRALIVSGEWLVIFKRPTETYLGAALSTDIVVYRRNEFKAQAGKIFKLIHRSLLTHVAPIPLRPAQLRQYVDLAGVAGAFQGVHVHYDRRGGSSSLFAPRPRISIYPAIFVVREDDAIYTVIDNDTPMNLDYQRDDTGRDSLTLHLATVNAQSIVLLAKCAHEIGGVLPAPPLSSRPGPTGGQMPHSADRQQDLLPSLHLPRSLLVTSREGGFAVWSVNQSPGQRRQPSKHHHRPR